MPSPPAHMQMHAPLRTDKELQSALLQAQKHASLRTQMESHRGPSCTHAKCMHLCAQMKCHRALVHTHTNACISARTDEELQGAASGGAAEAAARGVGGDGVRGRSRGPGSPPPRQASGWSLPPAPSGLGECLHGTPLPCFVVGVTGFLSLDGPGAGRSLLRG